MAKNNNGFKLIDNFNNNSIGKINAPSYSYWKSLFKAVLKKKIFLVALFIFITMVCLAIFVNIGKTNTEVLTGNANRTTSRPDGKHLFGTYIHGEDMWSVVWLGTAKTLEFILVVALFEIFIGVMIGAIWGFFQKLDLLMIQLIQLISIVPSMLFFVIVAIFLGYGFWQVVFTVLLTGWMGFASITRNNVNYVKHREYNLASKILGTPWYKILKDNVIPHILPVLLHSIAFLIPAYIGTDMTLSFLGFKFVDPSINSIPGSPQPTISLGYILYEVLHSSYIESFSFWYLTYFPLGVGCILSVSGYLVMKDFADLANPKTHK